MGNYLTNAEMAETLSLQGESFADADMTAAIKAAEEMLEMLTGRRFWLDAADRTRYYSQPTARYRQPTPHVLPVDDIVTVTSVAVAPAGGGAYTETWVDTVDYVLEPKNAPADGAPYTHIRTVAKTFTGVYPDSLRLVGRFGWPTVPSSIRQATTILAARLLKRSREAAFGVAAIGVEGSAVRVPRLDNDPDVMALVGHLIRRTGPARSLLV